MNTSPVVSQAPSPFAEAGIDGQLLALLVESSAATRENGLARVESSFQRLEELRAEIERALERAREAQEDSGFWSDVAGLFGRCAAGRNDDQEGCQREDNSGLHLGRSLRS